MTEDRTDDSTFVDFCSECVILKTNYIIMQLYLYTKFPELFVRKLFYYKSWFTVRDLLNKDFTVNGLDYNLLYSSMYGI
jgi:hypothetical protein